MLAIEKMFFCCYHVLRTNVKLCHYATKDAFSEAGIYYQMMWYIARTCQLCKNHKHVKRLSITHAHQNLGYFLPRAINCSKFLLHIKRNAHTEHIPESPASVTEAENVPVNIDNNIILTMLHQMKDNQPMADMENPYEKPPKKCLLCDRGIEINYKNVRLLSQFVSSFTGRIYGHEVTGLCHFMQDCVTKAIKESRKAGHMAYIYKKVEYMADPKLFDPFKPTTKW